MKILIRCLECKEAVGVKDAEYTALGELILTPHVCSEQCYSCNGCEDLELLHKKLTIYEEFEEDLATLDNLIASLTAGIPVDSPNSTVGTLQELSATIHERLDKVNKIGGGV